MVTFNDMKTNKLYATLLTLLVLMMGIFILTLTFKIGRDLLNVLQPIPVEAAPGDPGSEPTPLPVTETPLAVEVTPLPLTSTPAPEVTVDPTSTPIPDVTQTPIPQVPYLIAGESGVNVRTGPGLDYEKTGLLIPGAEALIIGYNADWWMVEINGETGWLYKEIVTAFHTDNVKEVSAPPKPAIEPTATPTPEEIPLPVWAIDEDRWIDVDLGQQRLTAYEMMTPVKSYLVSTGLPQTPTPVGQYRIWIKLKTDDMAGEDYYIEDVPWVMYFHLGYGLHGVTWHANFGHQMSHGCVNQPNDMAEWLFNFASVGTLVNVHE
jgi:lipoprotein-anchoring transpeptidase ErfK/SrfK